MLVHAAYESSVLAEANIPRPLTTVLSEQPRDIYLMAQDGSGLANLTSGQGREKEPAWSPDGNRLAFVSDRDGNHEIYVMNDDGSDLVRLTDNSEDDFHPVWSPDGTCLAFVSYREGAYGIYLLPVPTAPGTKVGEPWKLVDGGTSGGGLDWAP
jgi:TolB protein